MLGSSYLSTVQGKGPPSEREDDIKSHNIDVYVKVLLISLGALLVARIVKKGSPLQKKALTKHSSLKAVDSLHKLPPLIKMARVKKGSLLAKAKPEMLFLNFSHTTEKK